MNTYATLPRWKTVVEYEIRGRKVQETVFVRAATEDCARGEARVKVATENASTRPVVLSAVLAERQ